jgi:hypothetical protein
MEHTSTYVGPGKEETAEIETQIANIRDALTQRNVAVMKETLSRCDASEAIRAFQITCERPIVQFATYIWCCDIDSLGLRLKAMQAILEELVKAGANINEADSNGVTNAISTAVWLGNLPLCNILLRLGAEPAHTPGDKLQYSPLSTAVFAGPEYVALLLQYTKTLTPRDEFSKPSSALCCTLLYRHDDTLKLFMNWYEDSEQQFPTEEALALCFKHGYENSSLAILQRTALNLSENHCRQYFQSAASGGLLNVMIFLIELQPEVLQSEWLVNDNIPPALRSTKHQDFVAWLRDVRSQPLPLQLICRLNILRQLRSKPEDSIEELQLPKLLKDYLKEAEVFATFPSQ